MFSNQREWTVEWGDCDPAGIVFFPRFLAAMDTSTARLLEVAAGQGASRLMEEHAIVGWPMVDLRVRFGAPASFGDVLTIVTTIRHVGRSSFSLSHQMTREGTLCVDADEVRVWVRRGEGGSRSIASTPLPERLAERLKHG